MKSKTKRMRILHDKDVETRRWNGKRTDEWTDGRNVEILVSAVGSPQRFNSFDVHDSPLRLSFRNSRLLLPLPLQLSKQFYTIVGASFSERFSHPFIDEHSGFYCKNFFSKFRYYLRFIREVKCYLLKYIFLKCMLYINRWILLKLERFIKIF